MKRLFIFLAALLPLPLLAQVSITGRVLNQTDTRPVENASVFISDATIGDKTAADGSFTLHKVTPGKYNLVISIVGFDNYVQPIMVGAKNLSVGDILIFHKTIGLKEVVIKPDENRERNYLWFKSQFLGSSELAADCKIRNPDILSLDYDDATHTLTASTTDFLIIDNEALGYRIKYLLTNFSFVSDNVEGKIFYKGPVFFEEMKGTARQMRQWQNRRTDVYENSERHFLRAAISGQLDEECFRVLRYSSYQNPERPADSLIESKIKQLKRWKKDKDPRGDSLAYWEKKLKLPKILHSLIRFPLRNDEIVMPTSQPGIFALGCDNDTLLVSYNKDHRYETNPRLSSVNVTTNTENTAIGFNVPFALFNTHGVIVNPYDVVFNGVWGRDRVAELLPTDYDPNSEAGSTIASVDSTVFKNINSKLKIFAVNHIREKTYLHFDKPYYAAGDTIYFKAYLTAGDSNKLSNISSVLHADLINTAGKVDQSLVLQASDGVAWGDFALPDSLPKGGYRIRAYTRWMQNDRSGDTYFDKNIPLGSLKTEKIPESILNKRSAINKPDIQFFPEGGSLAEGVGAKIAFKVINNNGLGIDVTGEVTDDDNNQVATFASTHLGMGSFYLEPKPGKKYKAKITYPAGLSAMVNLPVATTGGITLGVDNGSPTNMAVTVRANPAFYLENKNKNYTLIVRSAGAISTYIFKLDNPVITADILKRSLRTGIASITLFSPAGEPLNERQVFIQNTDLLNISIKSNKETYAKREKVSLKLNIKNNNGDLTGGHFSVSVVDESQVAINEDSENTILTNLLLTSNLKGYVEQPNYYFATINPQTSSDLDLVMLTHGYRSFEWKNVFNNEEAAAAFQPEKRLEISGTVKSPRGKLLDNGTVSLLPLRGGPVASTEINKNGVFTFSNLAFADSSFFVIRASNTALKNRTLPEYVVENPLPVTLSEVAVHNPDELDSQMAAYLENRKIQKEEMLKYGTVNGILLKEVKVKERKQLDEYQTANLGGAGNADQIVHSDEIHGYGMFSDYFIGRLYGITFRGDMGQKRAYLTMPVSLNRIPPPMLLVVDGVMFLEQSMSPDEINLNDVETVEVLISSTATVYGSLGGAGVLIVTTKRGVNRVVNEGTAPGILVIKPKGFYKARQFYTPKYDHPNNKLDQKDLRATIYWNPEIVPDKAGNASFDFYNADGTGSYRVVVEGLDEGGNLGRQVYRYKVE